MMRSRCDDCGQPATVHETVIEGGKVIVRHRCPAHGREAWLDAMAQVEPRLRTDPASVLQEMRQIVENNPGFLGP